MPVETTMYTSLAETLDRKTILPTDCGTWIRYSDCPRSSLLRDLAGIEPRFKPKCQIVEERVIHSVRLWHRGLNREDVRQFLEKTDEPAMQLPDQAEARIEAKEIMEDYMDFDHGQPFNLVAGTAPFQHSLLKSEKKNKASSIYLCDRIDGYLVHEKKNYLVVHRLVDELKNQAPYVWSDYGTAMRAIYGGKLLDKKFSGVVYNLILSATPKVGSRKRSYPVYRQHVIFRKGFLAEVEQELGHKVYQFNRARQRGKSCIPNRNACFRNGEACPYLKLCSKGSAKDPGVAFTVHTSNPDLTEDQRDQILEEAFRKSQKRGIRNE